MREILTAILSARPLGIGRRVAATLISLQLMAAIVEFAGLLSFVPIFQYLTAQGNLEQLTQTYHHWRILTSAFTAYGIPVNLKSMLLMAFVTLLLRQAFVIARALYEHGTRERLTARLRTLVFSGFMRAQLEYQDGVQTGTIVADMNQNTVQAVLHVYGCIGLIVQSSICVVYLVGMIALDTAMTFTILLIVGIAGLIALPELKLARSLGQGIVDANRLLAAFVVERLKLTRLVRLAQTEATETAKFRTLADDYANVNYRVWRNLSLVDTQLETIAMSVGLLAIYVGVTYLGVGIEIVGVFLAMLLRLLPVVRQIAKTKQSVDSSRAAFDTVRTRLRDQDIACESSAGTRIFDTLRSGISFENVSYVYPTRPTARALDGVTLTIPARKLTAIVGPSGAGKSTLIDLLPRLREPASGRITVDGAPAGEFSLAGLRQGIAYLSQSPLILDVSLREFIAYGSPNASQTEIERVAKLAGIHDMISALPDGYETSTGEGGSRLSGGQRQRLDLARALLAKAPLLVLDEPTASLDAHSARQLSDAIQRIRQQTETTIVIISHSLSLVKDADTIIVLRDGTIEAQGQHTSLINGGGWYASAWRSQASTERVLAEH